MRRWTWLLGLLLAGCLSTDPAAWRASADDVLFKRALYECKFEAQNVPLMFSRIGGLFNRRGLFRECMEARGYTQIP